MSGGLPADFQIFQNAEAGKNSTILRNISQTEGAGFKRRQLFNRHIFVSDPAPARGQDSHDAFKRRCFARPVAPEQRHHLGTVDLQLQIKQDLRLAVIGVEGLHPEH